MLCAHVSLLRLVLYELSVSCLWAQVCGCSLKAVSCICRYVQATHSVNALALSLVYTLGPHCGGGWSKEVRHVNNVAPVEIHQWCKPERGDACRM